jgi:hypothetical protein
MTTIMALTEEQVLLMSDDDLKKTVRAAVPAEKDDFFHPEQYRSSDNPVREQIALLRADWQARYSKLVRFQAWFFPALIAVPALITLILKLNLYVPASLFVGGIIVTVAYFTFIARVSMWRKKKFDKQVELSEKESDMLAAFRANQWAKQRYTLPSDQVVEWNSYGSEFRLGSGEKMKAYRWVEVTEDSYQLFDVGNDAEATLRKKP